MSFPPLEAPPSSFNVDTSSSWELWAQAYCISPPADSCVHGYVCPNPDITGRGQQASIYVTEIIFAILIIYWPEKIRITLYSHLALIFSLQISAVIAIVNGQLTKNDATFVIVMVASPISLYLWFNTITRRPTLFPGLGSAVTIAEIVLIKVLCFYNLLFEIGLIVATKIPQISAQFSQASCSLDYPLGAILNLAWPLTLFVQALACIVALWIVNIGFTWIIGERGLSFGEDRLTDPVTWLQESTRQIFLDAQDNRSLLFPFLAAIIQVQLLLTWVPLPGFLFASHVLISCCTVVLTMVRRGFNTECCIFLTICIYSAGMTAWDVISAARHQSWGPLYFWPPVLPYAIITFICEMKLWKSLKAAKSRPRALCYFVFFNVWIWLFFAASFVPIGLHDFIPNPSSLSTDGFHPILIESPIYSIFGLVPLGWLLSTWWITTDWSKHFGERKGFMKSMGFVRHGINSRAHLLTFALLIAYPNALWVAATYAANPTESTGLTFGQTFAILTTVGTVMVLISEVYGLGREKLVAIFWAVVRTEEVKSHLYSPVHVTEVSPTELTEFTSGE